jgi:hypothetical protein
MVVRKTLGFCILAVGILFLVPIVFLGANINMCGGILIPAMIVSGTILVIK